MYDLDRLIYELTDYALSVSLIEKEDEAYTVSRLMELFDVSAIGEKRDTGADREPVTPLDFYNDGLSGGEGASLLRARLAISYGLPSDISAKALREAINLLSSRAEYREKMDEILASGEKE